MVIASLTGHNPTELFIAFHPDSEGARELAHALYRKYRRDPKREGANGFGLPVYFRHRPYPGSEVGLRPIDQEGAGAQVIFLILENEFVDELDDPESDHALFISHVFDLARNDPDHVRLIPVVLEQDARRSLPADFNKINSIRFYTIKGEGFDARFDLISLRITFDLAQFMRQLALTDAGMGAGVIERIQLFLSHTQDDAGEAVGALREEIRAHAGLSDFFYPIDTPVGFDFKVALEAEIERSAVLVIQSDSYSSREWCRWEVITAKKIGVPIVLANMVARGEERSFPYLGNVPVVGFDPAAPAEAKNSARAVIQATLEEVLRHLIWKAEVRGMEGSLPTEIKNPLFLAQPPEALSLPLAEAGGAAAPDAIIHPDPPLGAQETEILKLMNPDLKILTPSQLSARFAK